MVTIQVVSNLLLAPKQRLRFSTWASYTNRTFVLITTEGWEQRKWSLCSFVHSTRARKSSDFSSRNELSPCRAIIMISTCLLRLLCCTYNLGLSSSTLNCFCRVGGQAGGPISNLHIFNLSCEEGGNARQRGREREAAIQSVH